MIYYSHDHIPTQEDIKLQKLYDLMRYKFELQFKISSLTQELGKVEQQIKELEK